MKLFNYLLEGMAGVLALIIVCVFSLSIVDHYLLRTNSLASVISAVLVDLANDDRVASNLGGFAVSPTLIAAAQAKANDMATKGYFAHVSPEGVNSWYWFKQAGYTFLYAGENLAVDFSDSVDVEKAWMNSPTHRANILNSRFTEIGIATAHGYFQGRPTTFVVQMFGTPKAKSGVIPDKSAPSTAPTEIRTISSPTEATAPALATTEKLTPTAVLGTETDSIVPTSDDSVKNTIPADASWWQHLLASPKTMLRYAYYAMAVVILILLAYVTELEFHKRHMRQVVIAAFLFFLMGALFTIAHFLFFVEPVIVALK